MEKTIKRTLMRALETLAETVLPVLVTKEQRDDNGCSYGMLERSPLNGELVLTDLHNGPYMNPRCLAVESLPASEILEIVKDALAAAARRLADSVDTTTMQKVLSIAGRFAAATPRGIAARFIHECVTLKDRTWCWHRNERMVIAFTGTEEIKKPFVDTDNGVYRISGGLAFGEMEIIDMKGDTYILEVHTDGGWPFTIFVTPDAIGVFEGIKVPETDRQPETILPDESVLLMEEWFNRNYKF